MKTPTEKLAKERTRDKEQRLATEQTDRIALMMCRGEWFAGTSHAEIAQEVGVSLDVVKRWAKSAGRAVRVIAQLDADEHRGEILAGIEAVRRSAMAHERVWHHPRTGAEMRRHEPDHKAALGALDLRARVVGALAASRVDVRQVQSHQEWKALPLEEKRKMLEEARARLREAEAEVEAESRQLEVVE